MRLWDGDRDGEALVLLGCGNQGWDGCHFIGWARGSGASRLRPGGSAPSTRGGCRFGELRAPQELIRPGCSAAESAWGPHPRQPWPWPSDLRSTVGRGAGSRPARPAGGARPKGPIGFTNGRPCALLREAKMHARLPSGPSRSGSVFFYRGR